MSLLLIVQGVVGGLFLADQSVVNVAVVVDVIVVVVVDDDDDRPGCC